MDELIVRGLRGEATDIELRRLERWRAAALENEEAYREVVRLWERTEGMVPKRVPPPLSVTRIVQVADGRRRRARRWAVLRSARLAQVAAVAALAALGYLAFGPDAPQGVPAVALTPLESSLGPRRVMTLSLSDGSVVRATAETHLSFPSAPDRREVVLDGKAFFAVAHDEVPFEVRTAVGTITVVGTRFEVSTGPDWLRVLVVEGTVRLSDGGSALRVTAGQAAFLREGSPPRILDRADIWSFLDWGGGLLIFQATPLRQVADELARHFGLTVRVTDDEIGARRVTAWFEDESADEVVSTVCLVVDARCEIDGAEVTIGR